LRNKQCKIYHAPSDVRFPKDKKNQEILTLPAAPAALPAKFLGLRTLGSKEIIEVDMYFNL
jgi:hypothetical protein